MYRTRILKIGLAAAAAGMAMSVPSLAAESIIVQSTTSTQNSGLYKHLLPVFKAKAGIQVNVVAVGTGQAIRNARNCDGDVLLVHAKPSEEKFVKAGYGVKRSDLMYNDFIIVGPPADPAGVGGMKDAPGALKKSQPPRRYLPHAVTIQEPIKKKSACGRLQALT